MIVVAGIAGDAPVRLAVDAARSAGVDVFLLDERRASAWVVDLSLDSGGWTGSVTTTDGVVVLDEVTGAYLRLLGEGPRSRQAADPLAVSRRAAAVGLLSSWSQVTAARVANRPEATSSNGSKPYQAAVIAAEGFAVPELLVTNDPAEVTAFAASHGRVVFKSSSGVRSVVRELTAERSRELDRITLLPTQFQALVEGTNVRVHVVGEEVFACEVVGGALDYRYAETGTEPARLRAVGLPPDVEGRCVALSRALDLPLAGIDLLRDHDGRWWCFEVNPSPAYSCYEEPTGLPISRSLVRWLAGATPTMGAAS
jgi:hypothetical protein